jgi:hypothetical protein
MNEYVSPSALRMLTVDADISQSAVEDVASRMGVDTTELMVFCARADAVEAHRIANALGCTIVLVPNEIMQQDAWAAHHKQRHEFGMWSNGC